MKKGKSLEKLVAHLEKILTKDKNATVESPKKIRDRVTKKLREHDVVITFVQGHHQLLIAIECRDRSRPITCEQIECFVTKCRDTEINQGIIVSSKGFYKTARQKALDYGIRCLDLEQVSSFNWLLALGINQIHRKTCNITWIANTEEELSEKPSNAVLADKEKNEISTDLLNKKAEENLRDFLDKKYFIDSTSIINYIGPIKDTIAIKFDNKKVYLLDKDKNILIPLKELFAKIDYEITCEFSPFNLYQYYEEKSKNIITSVAVADLNIQDRTFNIILTKKDNENGHITIASEDKLKKKGK